MITTLPIILLVVLSFINFSHRSYAQSDNLHFEHLSPNPLPHTLVWSIYQDQEGFMWFGTYDGLVKYDGAATTIWKADPVDSSHTLRSHRIYDMHDDGQGSLWFPTEGGGLHQLNKRTGQVKSYPIDSLQTSGWDVAKSIFEDEQGKFWLSCSRGMACFDPATHQYSLVPFPDEPISFLQQDTQSRLWGVNQEGLWEFDTQTSRYTLLPLHSPEGNKLGAGSLYMDNQGIAWIGTYTEGLFRVDMNQKSPVALPYQPDVVNKYINRDGLYEADGYLWLATTQGLQRIDPKTHQVTTHTADPSLPGSLSNEHVLSIYQDRMDNLWVGQFPGINKASLLANPFSMHQIVPTPELFSRGENRITSVLQDHTGRVWVVSAARGLHQFDPLTQELTHVVVDPSHTQQALSNLYWPLLEDRQGRLWVGCGPEGLYLYNRDKGTFTRYDCAITVGRLDMDAEGRLWIGGWSEGMASFDPLSGQFTYYRADDKDTAGLLPGVIHDLLVSQSGAIWLSSTNGLSRMDPQTAQYTHYHPPYRTGDGYFHDYDLSSLYEDAQGMLWVGSRQGGLNRFDPRTGTFTQFTTRDGLPSNRVNSIVGDEQGNLWVGTVDGLSRFTPTTGTFRNFGTSDGLPITPAFLGASAYSRKGTLLFGTYTSGFVMFHPDSIQEEKAAVSPVYITGFKVLEKSVPVPDSAIVLSYDENFLSFEFVAINYDAYEKNQYAYQLVGVDKDWVYSDTRRFASYAELDPGDYTFRVKASNHDGVWNEQEASVQLVILPPWWQTRWAYALYGLLALGLLYGLRQYTVRRERLKHELKLQRLEAEKMHEIDQMKSRFFANISHEFRTPLTLILGPLEKFLTRTPEESQDKPVYRMMQRNAQRLLHLINQLLDLSKLEAGRMTLDVKPAPLVPFLKAMVLSFTSLAERQQIQYHFQYPTGQPVVYFDADKLEKIITNLLSNAFKFTPQGGQIIVSAQLSPAEVASVPAPFAGKSSRITLLEFKVQDSGVGMADDQLAQVFQRFYQADTSQTRAWEGSGIGLSLVHELVELHQGEVSVESQPGKGSCLTVRLPLWMADFEEIVVVEHALDNAQPLPVPSRAIAQEVEINQSAEFNMAEPTTEAPLILVVEDNEDVRAFVRETLQSAYQVIEAADGLAGYNVATDTIPDLILSDVMMPVMDGVELCGKLKADEKTAHIPVILLTAKAGGGDKIEGLETGADDYITKPFEAVELLARIRNLINSRKKLREHFSREIILQPASISITSADEQFLQRILQIIDAHIADTTFNVEAFSQEIGMSRTQLFRKLKALTNHSPGDLIRIMRLKRAADLLTQGAGNIAEVAFMVGFQDPSYFAKCFQKQFGQTPSEFLIAHTV